MNAPILTESYSDEDLHAAAKALLEEVADSPLLRMATVRTAAMLIAAFAIELPDPRAAAAQMVAEFRAEVEDLLDITLGLDPIN